MVIPTAATDRAARQRGLVTRAQLLALGMSTSAVDRRLANGELIVELAGVYRVPGAPRTWEQRAMAAALAVAPDGALSHRAAARLWGLLDVGDELDVVVPRRRAPRLREVFVHRSVDLVPAHVTNRRGVVVTNPLRTMVDLGDVVPWWLVREALDSGVANRLFTVAAVDAERDRLAASGRNGCGVLREALDRSTLSTRTRTKLEARMARLCRRHGLPVAAFQHRVVVDGRFLGQVDFAYPDRRIAIEVDGWEAHGSPTAMAKDYVRQNGLVAAGWVVLRFTWHQVTREAAWVASVIRAAFDAPSPALRG